MKLIIVQYPRLMVLSGLLLCTIVLCSINSPNSVSAQNSSSITPDLKIFFNDAIFPNSYPSTDFANVDDRSHGSKGGDAQGTTKAEDETTTAPEEEIEVTKEKVNKALFESGIFGLEVN